MIRMYNINTKRIVLNVMTIEKKLKFFIIFNFDAFNMNVSLFDIAFIIYDAFKKVMIRSNAINDKRYVHMKMNLIM